MTQAIFDNLRTDEQSWNARGEVTVWKSFHGYEIEGPKNQMACPPGLFPQVLE